MNEDDLKRLQERGAHVEELTVPQYRTTATRTDERFHVYQFFEDGQYERVRHFVNVDEAAAAAEHYCTSVGARLGTTVRVIITDTGDVICFEWKYGAGVVFPRLAVKGEQS